MQASIGAESESLQVSKRRMRFELMPFIRVTSVNGADLGNHIDHALGRKIAFLMYLAIALVMDVVLTMQIPLKGEFGKSVTGAIELFHGELKFLPGLGADNEFGLYRQVNIHLIDMPQLFHLRKGTRIPLHPKRSVYGWSILREER